MPKVQTSSKNHMTWICYRTQAFWLKWTHWEQQRRLTSSHAQWYHQSTSPSPVQSEDHWDWTVVFSCFLLQNHWSNNRFLWTKSVRKHCTFATKSGCFFQIFDLDAEKQRKFCHLRQQQNNLKKTGEKHPSFQSFCCGVRFRLLWRVFDPMEETDGLPRCGEMRCKWQENMMRIEEWSMNIYIYYIMT